MTGVYIAGIAMTVFGRHRDRSLDDLAEVDRRVAHEDAIMIPAHFAGNHMVRVARTSDGFAPQGL